MKGAMFRWSLFIVLLFPVHFVFGQALVGQIQGTVRDSDNQPIPGCSITASSPSLIGTSATSFTDEQGYYRFPALFPGTYQVKVELDYFFNLGWVSRNHWPRLRLRHILQIPQNQRHSFFGRGANSRECYGCSSPNVTVR